MPGQGELGDPDAPYPAELMGQGNGNIRRQDFRNLAGVGGGRGERNAVRDKKAVFGPALSDQDSKARKFDELRCWIPRNLEAGLGKEGRRLGIWEAGGDWKWTEAAAVS